MTNLNTAVKAVRSAYEGVLENECVVTETDFKALQRALLVAIEQAAPENNIPDIDYIHQAYINGYKDALGLLGKIAHSVRRPSAKLP